jgi:hypothetical protein
MEIVEAPDTMRPRSIHWPAARAAARESLPQWALKRRFS